MLANRHLLVCNGSPASGARRRGAEWSSVAPKPLSTHPARGNVNLKISDITDQMAKLLSPVVEDLVELSALVYAADQACKRTGGNTVTYGDQWRRTFRFEVAVREPEFWSRREVTEALAETLGFLSDDDYEFAFSRYSAPPYFGDYLEFRKGDPLPDPPARVILFSGGLDSLAGGAEEVFVHNRRVAYVSHRPVDYLAKKQRHLVEEIRRRAGAVDPTLRPLHFAVKANKSGELSLDNTQRSRSFLYASMAAAVADVFGLDRVHFYENGVVSVNLPLCGQEVGGRATRPRTRRCWPDSAACSPWYWGATSRSRTSTSGRRRRTCCAACSGRGTPTWRGSRSAASTPAASRSTPRTAGCARNACPAGSRPSARSTATTTPRAATRWTC